MPVQIGTTSASFADPTRLLSDCHRRIEMFLGALRTVAETGDHPLTERARKSLEAALSYFRDAAPKHTADEEESLFPRLRRVENGEARFALSRLDALEADHRNVAPLHAVVDELGRRYLNTGSLAPSEVIEFRLALDGLTRTYCEHIAEEDENVFPVAARLLSELDRNAIGKEMAARRNVPFTPTERQRQSG